MYRQDEAVKQANEFEFASNEEALREKNHQEATTQLEHATTKIEKIEITLRESVGQWVPLKVFDGGDGKVVVVHRVNENRTDVVSVKLETKVP